MQLNGHIYVIKAALIIGEVLVVISQAVERRRGAFRVRSPTTQLYCTHPEDKTSYVSGRGALAKWAKAIILSDFKPLEQT